jgi:bifunctional pyridoxal-dependent enzyme with beta-cystathionase and maltose regulon repressor activities
MRIGDDHSIVKIIMMKLEALSDKVGQVLQSVPIYFSVFLRIKKNPLNALKSALRGSHVFPYCSNNHPHGNQISLGYRN